MNGELPQEFWVELADDAMAPKAAKGLKVKFTRASQAQPGDAILVRDARGAVHFRELRLKRDGGWEAYAYNAAYPTLDGIGDGLEVIAVFSGIDGNWSQLMRG